MTDWTSTPQDFAAFDRSQMYQAILRQTVPGSVALAVGALVGAWLLYGKPAAPSFRLASGIKAETPSAIVPPAAIRAAPSVAQGPVIAPAAMVALRPHGAHDAPAVSRVAANPFGSLLDPGIIAGALPTSLAQSAPLGSDFQSMSPPISVAALEPKDVAPTPPPAPPDLAQVVPVPTPRPPELRPPPSQSVRPSATPAPLPGRASVAQAAPPDHRNWFEKLFGVTPRASGPALAYASAEDGAVGNGRRPMLSGGVASYDRETAVYDIAAHTVYLPNGTRLEAHSGLGNRLDDPRYVSERNRGPTPPHVYELQPREQLFHGVQALRLNPVGEGEIYGRNGLLAHTFMLGPKGDSNGCVSFRNYNAFLQAYMNGEVKRLVVVARLN